MSGVRAALDTNTAIHSLNGNPAVNSRLKEEGVAAVPAIVAGELLFGAANSARSVHNLSRCAEFLANCEVIAADLGTAQCYADLRLQLARAGRPIPDNDLWIAATCIQHGLVLVTNDSHFAHCPGLKTEDWLKTEPSS